MHWTRLVTLLPVCRTALSHRTGSRGNEELRIVDNPIRRLRASIVSIAHVEEERLEDFRFVALRKLRSHIIFLRQIIHTFADVVVNHAVRRHGHS